MKHPLVGNRFKIHVPITFYVIWGIGSALSVTGLYIAAHFLRKLW